MKKAKIRPKVFCTPLKGRQRFLRLLGDKNKVSGLRSGLVILKPQEAVGEHKTTDKEEAIIILKGSAIVHYGKNKKIKALENSFIYIPAETVHNISNPGRVVLKYVYITTQIGVY